MKRKRQPREKWIIGRCYEERRWMRCRLALEEAVTKILLRRRGPATEQKLSSPTSQQLLPGKGDPCVGHPIARISVVVRPVLFFQVLFLSDCRLPLPLSLSFLRFFFPSLVFSFHVATGLSAPIKTLSLTPSTRRIVSN